jgi:hypothetical protein
MKTKSIIIRTIFFFFPLIFIGCNDFWKDVKWHDVYYFSKDDLSYLYLDKDTLLPDEREIYFEDSLYFLINSKDTILAKVYTDIYAYNPYVVEETFTGLSGIKFYRKDGQNSYSDAFIYIEKDTDSVPNIEFTITIRKLLFHQYCSYFTVLNSSERGKMKLDTAYVLNQLYSNVIKFYPSKEDSTNKFKSIFFAKKCGYIRMETVDGEKIELINDLK